MSSQMNNHGPLYSILLLLELLCRSCMADIEKETNNMFKVSKIVYSLVVRQRGRQNKSRKQWKHNIWQSDGNCERRQKRQKRKNPQQKMLRQRL
ncbi:hypothetical protein CEXT_80621 [Caerostris extrusa]|uniref:Secreted protein n=1 Tax=Caerostris extrusa TaxID=172846 RepID=A0AAV4TP41_CAEEX|nr:hypothetical protein CEXT_80621 [Caerostris extrusa]